MSQILENEAGEQFVGPDGPVPAGYKAVGRSNLVSAAKISEMAGRTILPSPQLSVPTERPGILSQLGEMAKTAILPTVGTYLGQAVGSRAGTIGQRIGESVGAMTGTGANMALGLQEPSLGNIVRAGAAPMAGRLVGGVGTLGAGMVAPRLPGSAVALHEMSLPTMTAIPDLVRPGTPSGVLYEQLAAQPDIMVPTTKIRAMVTKLMEQETRASKMGVPAAPDTGGLLANMDQAIQPGSAVSFNDYWATVKRIGAKVGAYQKSGGEALGAAKQLYSAAMDDLEAAGNRYPALKSANQAYKQELAGEALDKVIQTQGLNRRPDGLIQLQPQAIRKWLANPDNADIVKNIPREELTSLHADLTKMEALPRMPPPAGQSRGFGQFGGRAGIGGLLGGLVTGTPFGAAMGGAAGAGGSYLVEKALTTDLGRKMLIKVMDRGPFLDHGHIAALAVAINAATSGGSSGNSGTSDTEEVAPGTRATLSAPLRVDTSQP